MSMIDRLGRKTLLLIGSAGCAICLFGVATIFFTEQALNLLVWFLVAYIGFFSFSPGRGNLGIYQRNLSDTGSVQKGRLGSSSHWVMNAIISGVFPILAKTSGAYPFAFFALMMVTQFVVVLFFFPETKGITLEEMEHRLGISKSHA